MKLKSNPLIQTDRHDHNAATSGIVSGHRDDHLDLFNQTAKCTLERISSVGMTFTVKI